MRIKGSAVGNWNTFIFNAVVHAALFIPSDITNHLAVFEQAHNRESTWEPAYQECKDGQSESADRAASFCRIFNSTMCRVPIGSRPELME